MATPSAPARAPRLLIVAVAVATLLAAALRTYGVSTQVVVDDEWHAIHKLMSSSYADIFHTFGSDDHSIPLTLLYKAVADTVGLTEWRLRALQMACGSALVPVLAMLAWRATRDAPVAALFAFLVAGAPFLVMYSRYARPYSIVLLLVVISLAALWRWRTQRSRRLAAAVVAGAALATWFFPLAMMYPAIGCLFVLFEDIAVPAHVQPRPSMQSFRLGAMVLGASLLLLAAPLSHDVRALTAKRGGDDPTLETLERVVSLFWGGLPMPAMVALCIVAASGAVVLLRRDRRLGLYLLLLGTLPAAILTLVGARYIHAGMAFARYTLPALPILLFLGSVGAMSLVRVASRRAQSAAAWVAATLLAAAYLAATPAIAQVATLGPWYAHMDHHWDYRYRWIDYKRASHELDPPRYYRKLARMTPGSAPIIEAPYIWAAPYNPLAYYALWHRQDVMLGMIYDLCGSGDRVGEPPPRDRRFRFRKFVFLDDFSAVKTTGARYLLLHRQLRQRAGSAYDDARCMVNLTRLYGAPIEVDGRLAVFDLQPGEPPPKLQ